MEYSSISDPQPATGRWKFILGGLLIITAIAYLIISSTRSSVQYFLTISEIEESGKELIGQDVRISGAVLGDTIQYNPDKLILHFTVVHIPGDMREVEKLGGIATVLHNATVNPNLPRLQVVYHGVKPDLLKNEAQAIMTGKWGRTEPLMPRNCS